MLSPDFTGLSRATSRIVSSTLNSNGFPKGKVGKKFKVHLPEKYSETPGKPVDAVVVDIPFKESFNANTREISKG